MENYYSGSFHCKSASASGHFVHCVCACVIIYLWGAFTFTHAQMHNKNEANTRKKRVLWTEDPIKRNYF